MTTPDQIPWHLIPACIICTARARDGDVIGAPCELHRYLDIWMPIDGESCMVLLSDRFPGVVAGEGDWRDSLQWRPGYEPKEAGE